jgi:hypothetical protein
MRGEPDEQIIKLPLDTQIEEGTLHDPLFWLLLVFICVMIWLWRRGG